MSGATTSRSSAAVVKIASPQRSRSSFDGELAGVRPVERSRSEADEPRAVRQQLSNRDRGRCRRRILRLPAGEVGDRLVEVEHSQVGESEQHAGHDHLARRRDQRHPLGSELSPVVLVDDPVVAVDHHQPRPVQPPLRHERLDDRRHLREVVRPRHRGGRVGRHGRGRRRGSRGRPRAGRRCGGARRRRGGARRSQRAGRRRLADRVVAGARCDCQDDRERRETSAEPRSATVPAGNGHGVTVPDPVASIP